MTAAECSTFLRNYNEWRRGDAEDNRESQMTNPRDIGLAIDMAISMLDQQPDIDTLEQESRQMRARMFMLEREAADKDEQVECSNITEKNMEGRLNKLIVQHAAMKDQRDELLAALEKCYKMLLSEPDTKGALFKSENIMREAIANSKESKK